MTFENSRTWYGSKGNGRIREFLLQTVQLEAPGNGMMRSGSNNSTPSMRILDLPLEHLPMTATIQAFSTFEFQKQLMLMMM